MTEISPLAQVLDKLCPMFALLNRSGHVVRAGATLQKLRPDQPLVGCRFLEVFELLRPRSITSMTALLESSDTKLHLRFRNAPGTVLKGRLVPLGEDAGAVVNLSFGISILDAVQAYQLTAADFSETDFAIELLYLVEAKSAAMDASRNLNQRLQGAKIAAEEQAFTDTLTGLKNRRALDHVLRRYLDNRTPFALMHVDLDHFKAVNDTHGHAAGDYVLQQVARFMVDETREEDTVARVGGDEFVIVFRKLHAVSKLQSVAARLIERIEQPMQYETRTCRISASMGTVLSDEITDADPGVLLDAADNALYAAKREGRACHRFYSGGA